jgi:hypothetical protein
MINVSEKIYRENQRTHFMFSSIFRKLCRLWDNAEKYSRVEGATDDNMAHTHFTLGTKGYKHTLRICNTYCFSAATIVARTRHNVNVIRTLPVCFSILSVYQYRRPIAVAHTASITTLHRHFRSKHIHRHCHCCHHCCVNSQSCLMPLFLQSCIPVYPYRVRLYRIIFVVIFALSATSWHRNKHRR